MAAAVLSLPPPSAPMPHIPLGSFTNVIYTHIREQRYTTAINILLHQLASHSTSRAAYSLLAHCYFMIEDYPLSAVCYEQLTHLFPLQGEYRYHWAVALFKSTAYDEALAQCQHLSHAFSTQENPAAAAAAGGASQINVSGVDMSALNQLQAQIYYDREDLEASATTLDLCSEDEATLIARGCIAFKQGKHEQAAQIFQLLLSSAGTHSNELAYSLAACLYEMGQFAQALKLIGDIIEYGVRNHPELSIGAGTEHAALSEKQGSASSAAAAAASGASPPSLPALAMVSNTRVLASSFLVEAFNLKAAIELSLKNIPHAAESLLDMPQRPESEIDAVTLHNLALVQMDQTPDDSLKKLQFIISDESGVFPTPCFHNLLIAYIKHECYDLCADILAENTHLHHLLTPAVYNYLECIILIQSNPAEAYRKLQQLGETHLSDMRKCTSAIQQARAQNDTEAVKTQLKVYDAALQHFIPILMAQCKIYWDMGHYEQVENILKAHAEFCSENDTFKLNVAHCFFMQETKYKEAIKYYEFIIHKNYQSVLKIMPIILANLCVSYIMVSENEEAEELMRIIEKEEEKEDQPKLNYHLCIVNIVIGTLYCSKNNFEFGISRIIKSFEPIDIKLNADTWYYAKKNLLSVCEYAAKHMLIVKPEMFTEMHEFLDQCQKHGLKIRVRSSVEPGIATNKSTLAVIPNTIAHEAREIKRFLYKLENDW